MRVMGAMGVIVVGLGVSGFEGFITEDSPPI
jgi:hypothetical protein